MPDARLLDSRIAEVTVFAAGALVVRAAEIADLVGQGGRLPERVRIGNLPLALDDRSLRVRVEAEGVVATDVAVALEVPDATASLPPERDPELEAARAREREVRRRLERCGKRLAQLPKLVLPKRPAGAKGAAPMSSPTDARLALLAFRAGETRRLADLHERLTLELAEAEEARRHHESRVAEGSTARNPRSQELRKSAVVTLSWGTAAPAGRLLLEYQVPAARWAPTYTIRFQKDMAEASLEVRAAIRQQTGEDWNGVSLTVSTADPLSWHELPELASRRIGRRQSRPPRRGWRSPPEGAGALYEDYDRARIALGLLDAPGPAPAPEPPEEVHDFDVLEEVGEAEEGEGFGDEVPTKPEMMALTPAPSPPPTRSARGPAALMMMGAPAAPRPPSAAAAAMRTGAVPEMLAKRRPPQQPAEPEPPGPLVPDSRQLAYRSLRMPSADASDRGRLRPATWGETREELLAYTRVELLVAIDVEQALVVSRTMAAEAASAPLPPRCRRPAPAQLAYSTPAELPVSAPSDGVWHVVPLAARAVPARLSYVVVPRESRDVFRVAELQNPLETPLCDGPADVYVDGRFQMTTDISLCMPGGVLALGLGVEPAIAVARNASFTEASSGMLGGSLALEHEVRVSVTNKLARGVELEVRERIPVPAPGVEDCKVKVVSVQPSWEEWKPADRPLEGGHRWRVALAAGASNDLVARYTVTIPAKNELVGGNRREG